MIAATLDIDHAAAVAWDAVVIGAGPAGAAAAIRLARRRRRVLLVDRAAFPRPKVCGCCLSPAAVRELSALELPAERSPRRVPLDAIWVAAAGREARIAVSGGATVSREALDTALVHAAIDAGAAWLPEATVTTVAEADVGATATLHGPTAAPATLRAGIVVIAAGLADAVRIRPGSAPTAPVETSRPRRVARKSFIGLGATLPADAGTLAAGQLVMAVGRAGYTGIVRLEDGRIDVAAAVDPAAVSTLGASAAVIDTILTEVGGIARRSVARDGLAAAAIRATPRLTHTTPLIASGRGTILRIGDAAAYVEPFTGEGIGWALASARVLAGALLADPSAIDCSTRFANAHARVFAAHHARCRRVAAFVRRPWLAAGAVHAARLAPAIAARVVPWIVGGGRLR